MRSTSCALFNMIDRLADSFGWHVPTDEEFVARARRCSTPATPCRPCRARDYKAVARASDPDADAYIPPALTMSLIAKGAHGCDEL